MDLRTLARDALARMASRLQAPARPADRRPGLRPPSPALQRRALLRRADQGARAARAVAELAKPGIVYTATRRDAERIAGELAAAGIRCAAYHGGMAAGLRDDTQAALMADELDAIVATTAFAMDVDKPNVRFVLHHTVLVYRPGDLRLRRFFAGAGKVNAEEIRIVAEANSVGYKTPMIGTDRLQAA